LEALRIVSDEVSFGSKSFLLRMSKPHQKTSAAFSNGCSGNNRPLDEIQERKERKGFAVLWMPPFLLRVATGAKPKRQKKKRKHGGRRWHSLRFAIRIVVRTSFFTRFGLVILLEKAACVC